MIIGNILGFLFANIYEVSGVFFSLLYIYLAKKESKLCWISEIISAFFFIIVFYKISLYSQIYVQFIFITSSILGYFNWDTLKISKFNYFKSTLYSFILILIGLLIKLNSNNNYDAYLLFEYSLILLNLLATVLQIYKKIDTWIVWIIVNILSIIILLGSNLYLTTFLYIIYLILSFVGFAEWKKKLK